MTRTIANPLPCVRCRYELRGLTEDAVCPECALPVQDSIDGRIDDARFAVIWRSVRILAWTISLKSPVTCTGLVLPAMLVGLSVAFVGRPAPHTAWLIGAGTLAVLAIAIVILEWGALLRLTSAAGVRGMTVDRRTDIGFLRAGVAAQVASITLLIASHVVGSPMLAGLSLIGVFVGRFTQFVGTCVVFGRLSRGLGEENLARWCFAMAWVIPVVGVAGSVLYGAGALVATGLNIATAIRMRVAVGREQARRRRFNARLASARAATRVE